MGKIAGFVLLSVAFLAVSACSKSEGDPQIFVPRLISPQGEDLSASHAAACDSSKVNFSDTFLTNENFQAMFACANYDHTLNGLEPLFTSRDFPQLITSVNQVVSNGNTKSLKDSLQDWLGDGPGGSSRLDRLLPVLGGIIKNPSFQDGLPVLSNVLQAGKPVWAQLLPGLADVVYSEEYPNDLQDAFTVFNGMTSGARTDQDYATGIKSFAAFLKSDVDGKTAAARALELLDQIRTLQPSDTSFYQLGERAVEFGVIDDYFINSGASRGEVIDSKLNEPTDDPSIACAGLNDTAEHRQQCASLRLWRRGADGSEAPITQLAGLVAEFEKDHPDFLPALAAWFQANGPRVTNALGSYVVRLQVAQNLTTFNVGTYLQAYATKNGLDLNAPVASAQLADVITKGFASPDYAAWVATVVPGINLGAFGPQNAPLLANTTLPSDVAALYQSPEVAAFAQTVLPDSTTAPLGTALKKFSSKHLRGTLQVAFRGTTQPIDKQLGDLWVVVVRNTLGDDVVMRYVVHLLQSLATDMARDFKNRGQPLAEWYFTSPYGDPDTTEMLVGYATRELDLLTKYYNNRDWLMNGFADEVFGDAADDKRAFRLLLGQVPNMVTYVRSGASRSGGDLTRAMAKGTDGYFVKTYVNLIAKASSTGWVSRGARLLEAYQASPGYQFAAATPVSDDIGDRREYKEGVEALVRISRSLTMPAVRDDYSSTTLSRFMVPVSSVVSGAGRDATERLLLTSADQVLGLSDAEINHFVQDLRSSQPGGDPESRRATFKSVADFLRHPSCPDVVLRLSNLFQDNAVKPALNFFATKIDDGSLQRVLLFVRRMLGFAK